MIGHQSLVTNESETILVMASTIIKEEVTKDMVRKCPGVKIKDEVNVKFSDGTKDGITEIRGNENQCSLVFGLDLKCLVL